MLETGIKAPEFTLKNQDGEEVSLKDFRGKKVILYFYPKDNTPGCTTQACSFGDRYPQIQEKGAVVLGVSKDSVASHKKFAEKYHLPFALLAESGAGGHPGIRCMAGKKYVREKGYGCSALHLPD